MPKGYRKWGQYYVSSNEYSVIIFLKHKKLLIFGIGGGGGAQSHQPTGINIGLYCTFLSCRYMYIYTPSTNYLNQVLGK